MSIKYWLKHIRCRMLTALIFCMVFSLLAFAPPFSSSAHAIALVDDSIALVVIALLASAGITITASSSVTATDWLLERIQMHAAYAGYVWDEVKSGFQIGVNKLGDILSNNSLLTWFSDFAEWLKTDYNLTDDTDTPIVTPGTFYFLGNAPVYPLPIRIDRAPPATSYSVYTLENCYCYFHSTPGSDIVNAYFFSLDNTSPVLEQTFIYNGDLLSSTRRYGLGNTSYSYYYTTFSLGRSSALDPFSYTVNELSFIASSEYPLTTSGSTDYIDASVDTLTIPVDGTDFVDTDGTIVTGIGSWGDTLSEILEKIREWLDAQSPAGVIDPTLEIASEASIVDQLDTDLLSTDNWPGMLPPVGFAQFSFSSIWHYVTEWLSAFSGTLATVLGISFALPAVSIVYAVIVLSLTLWLLRKVSS